MREEPVRYDTRDLIEPRLERHRLHDLEVVHVEDHVAIVGDDTLPPFRPSGIRLGTPAITTRGLKEEDMARIANWIFAAIEARDNPMRLAQLRSEVESFALQFPLPSDPVK